MGGVVSVVGMVNVVGMVDVVVQGVANVVRVVHDKYRSGSNFLP